MSGLGNKAWKENLLYRLNSEMPGLDHNPLIRFLSEGLLPNSSKYESFANALNNYGYNKRVKRGIYKNEVREAKKLFIKATNEKSLEDAERTAQAVEEHLVDRVEAYDSAQTTFEGSQIVPHPSHIHTAMGLSWVIQSS